MHPLAVRTDSDPNPFARTAHLVGEDWVDGGAEAVDMALAARAVRTPDGAIAAAFGVEAARLARVAAAFEGDAPPLPSTTAAFTAALESHVARAFDARSTASLRVVERGGPFAHRGGLIARRPALSELALAAAVVVAIGSAAMPGGWQAMPALAATPTQSVHRTQTPLGPTGTATGSRPAALATVEPVAMVRQGEQAKVN